MPNDRQPPAGVDADARPPSGDAVAARERESDERPFLALAPMAQASVAGAYAWVVTVSPVVLGRLATPLSRTFAAIALVALVLGPLLERHRLRAAMLVEVWGFPLASACAWLVARPGASAAARDAISGLSGMLAWGLFAFAAAAPPPRRSADEEGRVQQTGRLRPRGTLRSGDTWILLCAIALTVAFQTLGWAAPTPERALLVRLAATVSGIAVLGVAVELVLARHRARAPAWLQLRRVAPTLLILATLLALGVFLPIGTPPDAP
jgi:hypothetical protein